MRLDITLVRAGKDFYGAEAHVIGDLLISYHCTYITAPKKIWPTECLSV